MRSSIRVRRMSWAAWVACGTLAAAMIAPPNCRSADAIAVKSGEKIAFLGDSITAQGAASPSGYVRLVISGLEANGVKAVPIPAGVSGHKSNDMLARLDRDVLKKAPNWMTLSCGVNDVWHGARGVPLGSYKTNITAIVDQAQAAGIKVMILTSTMIGEDAANANNQKLAAYNEFLKALAKEKNCVLADLNADMQAALAEESKRPHTGHVLTVDGVHMNPIGNMMMATGILKAFGLDDTQLKKARDAWFAIPNAVEITVRVPISLAQYEKLDVAAAEQKCSLPDLVAKEAGQSIETLLGKGAK